MTPTPDGRDLATNAGHTPTGFSTLSPPDVVTHEKPKLHNFSPSGGARQEPGHARPVLSGGAGAEPPLACQYRNKSTPRRRLRYVAACEAKAWSIVTWRRSDPGKKKVICFTCRSWRHEGSCRKWKGAQDFVRCREAIGSRSGWTYVVLTFDPRNWPGRDAAFKGGKVLWNRLRSALIREFGPIDYLQTWEATRKGWPHVNILLHNATINGMRWKAFRQLLKLLAVRAGFGKVLWAEPMKHKDAMAGYIVKLANELTGAGVKNQVPVDAPKHFRRLRASRGLLPPAHKNPDITGEFVQAPKEYVEAMLDKQRPTQST